MIAPVRTELGVLSLSSIILECMYDRHVLCTMLPWLLLCEVCKEPIAVVSSRLVLQCQDICCCSVKTFAVAVSRHLVLQCHDIWCCSVKTFGGAVSRHLVLQCQDIWCCRVKMFGVADEVTSRGMNAQSDQHQQQGDSKSAQTSGLKLPCHADELTSRKADAEAIQHQQQGAGLQDSNLQHPGSLNSHNHGNADDSDSSHAHQMLERDIGGAQAVSGILLHSRIECTMLSLKGRKHKLSSTIRE